MSEEFNRAVYAGLSVLNPAGVTISMQENGRIILPPYIYSNARAVAAAILRAVKNPTDKTMDAFASASAEEWNAAIDLILDDE